jgi:hypothetical protein
MIRRAFLKCVGACVAGLGVGRVRSADEPIYRARGKASVAGVSMGTIGVQHAGREFTVTTIGRMCNEHVQRVAHAVCRTNSDAYYGCEPGTVMLIGAKGKKVESPLPGPWMEYEYTFSVAEKPASGHEPRRVCFAALFG